MVVKGQLLGKLETSDEASITTPMTSDEETTFDFDDFDLEATDEVF